MTKKISKKIYKDFHNNIYNNIPWDSKNPQYTVDLEPMLHKILDINNDIDRLIMLDAEDKIKRNSNALKFDIYIPKDPIVKWFCRFTDNILLNSSYKYKPFWYQMSFMNRVCESVLMNDGDEIKAQWARQMGKSNAVGALNNKLIAFPTFFAHVPKDIIVEMVGEKNADLFIEYFEQFYDGNLIGVYAPSEEQIWGISNWTWDLFDEDFLKKYHFTILKRHKTQLLISNELYKKSVSSIYMRTASPRVTIQGRTFILTIEDESQDMDAIQSKESIAPMRTARNGTGIYIGTTSITPGHFFEKLEDTEKTNKKNKFKFDYLCGITAMPQYLKFIRKKIESDGILDETFQRMFQLKWLFEIGMAIPPNLFYGDIDEGGTKKGLAQPIKIIKKDNTDKIKVASIDWAKTSDRTIVTVGECIPIKLKDGTIKYKVRVYDWLVLRGTNYNEQLTTIALWLEQYHPIEKVISDATGGSSGEAMTDFLSERLPYSIIAYDFKGQRKAELCTYGITEIHSNRVVVPNSHYAQSLKEKQTFELFKQDCLNATKTYVGSDQRILIDAPDNKTWDFLTSLLLLIWACKSIYNDYGYTESIIEDESISNLIDSIDKKAKLDKDDLEDLEEDIEFYGNDDINYFNSNSNNEFNLLDKTTKF